MIEFGDAGRQSASGLTLIPFLLQKNPQVLLYWWKDHKAS